MELWTLDADGSVVAPTELDRGRRFAGAILILIGGWLAWQIVRAIRVANASTHAPWSEYIPGVLMFGGVALAFLVPGAMMLLYKRSVRFDLAAREVADSRSYLGYQRRRVYPLSTFKTIVLARRSVGRPKIGSGSRGRRGKSHPVFVVDFASADGKVLKITTDQHEAPARDVAAKLKAITALPLQDDVEAERVREERGLDDEDEES